MEPRQSGFVPAGVRLKCDTLLPRFIKMPIYRQGGNKMGRSKRGQHLYEQALTLLVEANAICPHPDREGYIHMQDEEAISVAYRRAAAMRKARTLDGTYKEFVEQLDTALQDVEGVDSTG